MARPINITNETIVDTLVTRPEVTAAEVAETLGIGQSTAAKRLAALEAAGSVRRTPGGGADGRRLPDRWAVAATTEAQEIESSTPAVSGPAVGDPAPNDIAAATAAADAGRAGGPDTDVTDAIDAPTDGTNAPRVGQRLGRGELGSLVRDYLAARPDQSFGPSAVGKALGRSQGAVSNSLATMAAKGEVVLVGDKPRRYRIPAG